MGYIHVFAVLSNYLTAIITQGGYVILFITSTLEGIPLVGMLVPGHVAIIIAGFLAKIGTLDLTLVIIVAIAGSLLGDFIGFMLGRKYGLSFIDRLRPYFFITDQHIKKAQNLLSKHTGKAMLLGRFNPITRALMPFLVGTSHVSHKKFWVFNIIGVVSWSLISIFIGYAFGAGYHAAAGFFGKVVLTAIIMAVLIIWGYRFINIRFHIFKKYELIILGLNLISLWALAKTVQDAWAAHSFMANFDIFVNMFMTTHVTPFMAKIALFVTNMGSTIVTGGLGILLGIIFAFRKKWRSAAVMFLSIGLTGVMLGFMKEIFLRARPDNALQTILNDPSFPSGHAGLAAAFFFALAYLFAPKIRSWVRREIFLVLCVLAMIAIGLSRVVLNVHWASDVIAGWSLGIFMATGSILLVRYLGALIVKKKS